MPNMCSRYSVRGCPASFYLICDAYAQGKNCWEVGEKPCCRKTDLSQCKSCNVYMRYLEKRVE